MKQQPVPQCPFTKQACVKERCAMWQSIQVMTAGPLVGSIKQGVLTGCSFNLMAVFLGRLNNLATPPPAPSRQPGKQN